MLDPVRFLSNVSTGTMGYETARVGKNKGCKITLISGPTGLKAPAGVKLISVLTAQEMKQAVLKEFAKSDALIMTAAVCDYTPVHYSKSKIKRIRQKTILFKRTDDILAEVGKQKKNKIVMGFALETENIEQNAVHKLERKNLDFIVANWYGKGNNPFGKNRTSMTLIDRVGNRQRLNRVTKSRAGGFLIDVITDAVLGKKS